MPGKRVSMRKTREVLRLYFELKLGQRQLARSANVSQSTVHDSLERFTAAALSWPLPEELSETELEAALFPADPGKGRELAAERALPDFAHIHEELQQHKHTTRQLLWEEYRAAHPGGYNYSRFCYLYQRWKQERDVVLRQEHRAGEKLFVDWAGATMPLYNPQSGEVRQASLFVAVLGASNYTYAEASENRQLVAWVGAHVRTFELASGKPTSRSASTKAGEPMVESIRDQGYAVIPEVFSYEMIDGLLRELEHAHLPRSRAGVRHAMRIRTVAEMARRAPLRTIAQEILGEGVFPFRATLFDKSATANWLVMWHQDTALPLPERCEVPEWGPWSVKEGVHYAHAPAGALEQGVALRFTWMIRRARTGRCEFCRGRTHSGCSRTSKFMTCPKKLLRRSVWL